MGNGKRHRKAANRIVDLLMVILLPLLMAYSLIGEVFHEVVGTAMLLLFLMHHFLHWKWWKAICKGRYSPYRICTTILNIILTALMLAQPLSGIAMSRHLYSLPIFTGTAGTARQIHMVLAYWCYVLMCFHLGLHVDAMIRSVKMADRDRPFIRWGIRILVLSISAYGVYAFVKRGFPGYMFMRTIFAFLDFGEPIIFFFADYMAVMILFAACGCLAGRVLKEKL